MEDGYEITQFTLFTQEETSFGCYYSPNELDAFRKMDIELVQNGHSYWEWESDDGNYGALQKIKDGWYYFENVEVENTSSGECPLFSIRPLEQYLK